MNTEAAIDLRLGRHRYWYLKDLHRLVPQVRGAADGAAAAAADHDDDDADTKKFTQGDLERHAAKEKRQGRRAATRELMEKFGFDSVEDAEEFIEKARKASSKPSGKDDPDGGSDDGSDAAAAAADRESKAKGREEAAARKETEADVRIALIAAGAPTDKTKLAEMARMIDIETGADEDTIDDAVEEYKQRWPQLFGSDADDDQDDDDDGAPDNAPASAGGKRRRPGKEDGFARADRRFESRHPKAS